MSRTTILVSTSSLSDYETILRAVSSDPSFRVLPRASGLMETFDRVEHRLPSIVIIDRDLTIRAEFELMRALFEVHDVRWLIWEHSAEASNGRRGGLGPAFEQKGGDLFVMDASMPEGHILRYLRSIARSRRNAIAPPPRGLVRNVENRSKMILIGASTGGVDAVINVISRFGGDCPPTVVIQHTGQRFGESLVNLLGLRCAAEVVLCRDGLEVKPGRICVAAGTPGHAILTGPNARRITLVDDGLVNGHMPSIDRTFHSAVPVADQVVAVILTGMGKDGAGGLLALREAGATTMAQDEETSVVYGMPRVAWETGAAQCQLPIGTIGSKLLSAAKEMSK